jgi:hypothetical protein
VSEQPTIRQGASITPRPVVSRTADIAVVTTERGLPTQLKIAAAAMSRAPDDLAHEILSLCQLSAMRQQVARRRELRERNVDHAVVRGLNLATEEDLAKAEEQARGDNEGPLQSWTTSR